MNGLKLAFFSLLVCSSALSSPFSEVVKRIEAVEELMGEGRYREVLERHLDLVFDVEVVEKWAGSDPGGLWRWLVDGGGDTLSPRGFEKVAVKKWLLADPERAFAEVRSRGVDQRLLLAAVVAELICDRSVDEVVLADLVKRVEWERPSNARIDDGAKSVSLARVDRLPDCYFVRQLREMLEGR